MPYQLSVRPTAAQSILAAGDAIGGSFEKFFEGIEKRREEDKKNAQKSTSYDRLLSIIDPDNADKFKTMSLAEKEGWFEGLTLKRAQERERTNQEYMQAMTRNMTGNMERQQRIDRDTSNFFRSLGVGTTQSMRMPPGMGTIPPTFGAGMTPQAQMQALSRNPMAAQGIDPRHLQSIIGGPQQHPAESFRRIPGANYAAGPGGQVVPLPGEQDPSARANDARAQLLFEASRLRLLAESDDPIISSQARAQLQGILKQLNQMQQGGAGQAPMGAPIQAGGLTFRPGGPAPR